MLTKAFGEAIWKKAMLVLTFANYPQLPPPQQPMKDQMQKYAQAFQDVMHSAKLTSFRVGPSLKPDTTRREATMIPALPAGKCRDEVIIEGARWDDNIYMEVLNKCEFEAIPALLHLKGIPLSIALASIDGVGTSATVGGGVGAGVGAVVGGIAGFGAGAIPGAIIGGAIGACASAIATTSILGIMAVVAKRFEEEKKKKFND